MSIELLENYFEELTSPGDLLFNWRKKSWDRFLEVGLPKRKHEAFRYVPLQNLTFPPPSTKSLGLAAPQPIVSLPLDAAMRSYGLFLQNRLSQLLKEETDPFAILNGALQNSGFFLYVPPNTCLETPLELDQLFPPHYTTSSRIHLYLGKGAQLKLIRRVSGAGCSNVLIDFVLDKGAALSFFDVQDLSQTAQHWSAVRAKLKRDSRFSYVSYSRGAAIARSSLKVQLSEENGEAYLYGLSDLTEGRHHHIHALMDTAAPHVRSQQHFKSVLQDKSVFSFEGKIFVHPVAQKTESYQLNNNLLLSDEAKAYAKPNLEIFADDVKASHGATTGQLDREAYFYLRSRGLPFKEARQWLIEGFCKEILDLFPQGVIRA